MAVCLAIDGRCSQADFQAVSMCAIKRIGRGPGLDMNGQNQVFTVPLVPLCSQCLIHYPDGMPQDSKQQGAMRIMEVAAFPGGRCFTGRYVPTSG